MVFAAYAPSPRVGVLRSSLTINILVFLGAALFYVFAHALGLPRASGVVTPETRTVIKTISYLCQAIIFGIALVMQIQRSLVIERRLRRARAWQRTRAISAAVLLIATGLAIAAFETLLFLKPAFVIVRPEDISLEFPISWATSMVPEGMHWIAQLRTPSLYAVCQLFLVCHILTLGNPATRGRRRQAASTTPIPINVVVVAMTAGMLLVRSGFGLSRFYDTATGVIFGVFIYWTFVSWLCLVLRGRRDDEQLAHAVLLPGLFLSFVMLLLVNRIEWAIVFLAHWIVILGTAMSWRRRRVQHWRSAT